MHGRPKSGVPWCWSWLCEYHVMSLLSCTVGKFSFDRNWQDLKNYMFILQQSDQVTFLIHQGKERDTHYIILRLYSDILERNIWAYDDSYHGSKCEVFLYFGRVLGWANFIYVYTK